MDNLNEFDKPSKDFIEVSTLMKNISGIIDAVFTIILTATIKLIAFNSFSNFSSNLFFLLIVFLSYRFLTIVSFSRTLGMLIMNQIFISADKEKLTIKEKLFASLMVYINGIDCYNIIK